MADWTFTGGRKQQQRVKLWIFFIFFNPHEKDGWSRGRAARSEVGHTTRRKTEQTRRQQPLFVLSQPLPPEPREGSGGGARRPCPRFTTMKLPCLLALTALFAHATVSTSVFVTGELSGTQGQGYL